MEDALGEYLYYPAAFLVCVNILLFTATCVKLCMFGRGPTVRTRKTDARGEWYVWFIAKLLDSFLYSSAKYVILDIV